MASSPRITVPCSTRCGGLDKVSLLIGQNVSILSQVLATNGSELTEPSGSSQLARGSASLESYSVSCAHGAHMFVTPTARWGTNRECGMRNAQCGSQGYPQASWTPRLAVPVDRPAPVIHGRAAIARVSPFPNNIPHSAYRTPQSLIVPVIQVCKTRCETRHFDALLGLRARPA